MAAAAAVATGKKRKRPHIFESNPSIRKRQQTRLLRWVIFPLLTEILLSVPVVTALQLLIQRRREITIMLLQETAGYTGRVYHQSGPAGYCVVYLSLQTESRV